MDQHVVSRIQPIGAAALLRRAPGLAVEIVY